jgi:hypothetical protein
MVRPIAQTYPRNFLPRAQSHPVTRIKHITRCVGTAFAGLILLGTASWGVLALYYFDHKSISLRIALATAFTVVSMVALVGFALRRWRWRRRALTLYLALFAALLAWWSTITPSNDRDWQPDVAVLSYATIDGDRVTVHNIRNFDYRTETDFTPVFSGSMNSTMPSPTSAT